jgi:hypothetical protein
LAKALATGCFLRFPVDENRAEVRCLPGDSEEPPFPLEEDKRFRPAEELLFPVEGRLPLATADRFGLAAAAAFPRPDPDLLVPFAPDLAFPLLALAFPPVEALLPEAVLPEALPPVVLREFPLPDALPELPLPDALRDEPFPDALRDEPFPDPFPEAVASSPTSPGRRSLAWAPLATRSPEAFPVRFLRAAVARLTEAASLAAARALRGFLAVVAMS